MLYFLFRSCYITFACHFIGSDREPYILSQLMSSLNTLSKKAGDTPACTFFSQDRQGQFVISWGSGGKIIQVPYQTSINLPKSLRETLASLATVFEPQIIRPNQRAASHAVTFSCYHSFFTKLKNSILLYSKLKYKTLICTGISITAASILWFFFCWFYFV